MLFDDIIQSCMFLLFDDVSQCCWSVVWGCCCWLHCLLLLVALYMVGVGLGRLFGSGMKLLAGAVVEHMVDASGGRLFGACVWRMVVAGVILLVGVGV